MTQTPTSAPARLTDVLLNVGAPLLAIAAVSLQYQVPIGAMATILAAVLAGVLVPVFNRFIGVPFLRMCGTAVPSVTSYVFLAACNAGLGLGAALLTLPAPA